MSLETVQTHALARELGLPPSARDLERKLRTALRHASDTGRLRSTPSQIHQYLRLLKEPPPSVAGQLATRGLRGDAACVVGGDKNQDRLIDLLEVPGPRRSGSPHRRGPVCVADPRART